MTTILFADDDILTLNKLQALIDWPAHGYEVVGQAMDGDGALAMVRAHRPDILILDINMPRRSGISVVQALHSQGWMPYVLVLSNHDTFDYVRQVMRYGAQDYLLKHELTAELLLQKLSEIEALRKQSAVDARWDQHTAALAMRQYLRDVALGRSDGEEMGRFMREQPAFASRCNVPALLRIEGFRLLTYFDGEAQRQRIIDTTMNLVSSATAKGSTCLFTHLRDGLFLAYFIHPDGMADAQARQQASAWMSMLASNLHRFLGVTVRHLCGGVISAPQDIAQAYAQLSAAMCASWGDDTPAVLDARLEHALMDALTVLDMERISRAVRNILAEKGVRAAESLLRISAQMMDAHGIQPGETYLRQLQNTLREPLDAQALQALLTQHFERLAGDALASAWRGFSPHIQSTLSFLHAQYARNITLGMAADAAGISVAYLSRQFHKEVGQSFIDYLTSYRIERVKDMLKGPGARIKTAAAAVGFTNYNYFLRVFKKHTGMTVTQYMEQQRP